MRVFALLLLFAMAAESQAADWGQIAGIVENQVQEMARGIVRANAYRSLVVDTLFLLTATIFFVFQILKAALTGQGESPIAVYINICLTILAVALTIKLYDDVTEAVRAFFLGLSHIIQQLAFNGKEPMKVIEDAQAYIRDDPTGLNGLEDLRAVILAWVIGLGMSFLSVMAWSLTTGAAYVFATLKVIGFVTLPFMLFKWSAKLFSGLISGLLWCVMMKPAAAMLLAIATIIMQKWLEFGGGKITELATGSYGQLVGVAAMFWVAALAMLTAAIIVGLLVGARGPSVDVSGAMMNIASSVGSAVARTIKRKKGKK